MFLYHGTGEIQGQQIFKDGFIKSQIKRHYDNGTISGVNISTTDGFVYHTESICQASLYAFHAQPLLDYVYIFKVDIPYSLLEIDYDELRIQSLISPESFPVNLAANDSLQFYHSTRVACDLVLSDCKATFIKNRCI